MSYSTKITYSRLLYADFISDEYEETEIIKKINGFGFVANANEGNAPTKFCVGNLGNFIKQIQKVCKSDSELLDYINNVVFWIYREGILPLKVVIIEVILKPDGLQDLNKSDLEKKIWNLSYLIGICFSEGPIPPTDSSMDFRILKFSSKAIPNIEVRNFVAEFVIEGERKLFDDFNKELDSLEKATSTEDLIERTITENPNLGKLPSTAIAGVLSKATEQQDKNIGGIHPMSYHWSL